MKKLEELILTKLRKYAAIDMKKQFIPIKLDSKSKSIKYKSINYNY